MGVNDLSEMLANMSPRPWLIQSAVREFLAGNVKNTNLAHFIRHEEFYSDGENSLYNFLCGIWRSFVESKRVFSAQRCLQKKKFLKAALGVFRAWPTFGSKCQEISVSISADLFLLWVRRLYQIIRALLTDCVPHHMKKDSAALYRFNLSGTKGSISKMLINWENKSKNECRK